MTEDASRLRFERKVVRKKFKAPPKLEFKRIPSITMNGFTSLPTPVSSPNLLQTTGLDDSFSTSSPPHSLTNSHSNNQASSTSPRETPSHLRAQSWLLPQPDTEQPDSRPFPRAISPTTPTPTLNDENNNTTWSSAVGRATTGKSGRVIERLMAENDRLRRELRAELSAREELQKRLDTSRPITEALQIENGNLAAMRASDAAVIARRERKIEELKTDLEGERRGREGAERRANESVRGREDAERRAEREVREAGERARYAMVQAEILEGSHRQLRGEYRQRTETLARGVQEAVRAREEGRGRLQRLDVVVGQMGQELERANRVNGELRGLVDEYGRESERKVREVGEEAEEKDREGKRLREEMGEVVEKMKWVMSVKQNTGLAS
ncbi:MAG: hypothetical protein Q9165_007413 [Trypethelium subeluteriae]